MRFWDDESLPALEDPTKLLARAVYGDSGAGVRAVLQGGGLLALGRHTSLGQLLLASAPSTLTDSKLYLFITLCK